MIKLIAAVDLNWGLGYKNELLFHIEEDMKRFRRLTEGHIVVMGRKTYESFEKPLKKRVNVVLTRNKEYKPNASSVFVEHDINKVLKYYNGCGGIGESMCILQGNFYRKENNKNRKIRWHKVLLYNPLLSTY